MLATHCSLFTYGFWECLLIDDVAPHCFYFFFIYLNIFVDFEGAYCLKTWLPIFTYTILLMFTGSDFKSEVWYQYAFVLCLCVYLFWRVTSVGSANFAVPALSRGKYFSLPVVHTLTCNCFYNMFKYLWIGYISKTYIHIKITEKTHLLMSSAILVLLWKNLTFNCIVKTSYKHVYG